MSFVVEILSLFHQRLDQVLSCCFRRLVDMCSSVHWVLYRKSTFLDALWQEFNTPSISFPGSNYNEGWQEIRSNCPSQWHKKGYSVCHHILHILPPILETESESSIHHLCVLNFHLDQCLYPHGPLISRLIISFLLYLITPNKSFSIPLSVGVFDLQALALKSRHGNLLFLHEGHYDVIWKCPIYLNKKASAWSDVTSCRVSGRKSRKWRLNQRHMLHGNTRQDNIWLCDISQNSRIQSVVNVAQW